MKILIFLDQGQD